MKKYSTVKISVFDDGNQQYKNMSNNWTIIDFKFNKSKTIIKHSIFNDIKPFSISSWKLEKITSPKNICNQQTPS